MEASLIDVFRVGVHLGFTSNGIEVIGTLMRELGLLHHSVDGLGARWRRMSVSMQTATAGAVAAFAGTSALRGMWHMVEASKELNKELEKTRQLGGDFAASLDQTKANAFRTSFAVPTNAPSEDVRVTRELGAQMQNMQAARDILPEAQRTAYVISHFTGEKMDEIVKNLVKVAENRAQVFSIGPDGKEHVDQAKVRAEFDGAMRALLITGGFLKSGDLVTMGRQAGVPAKEMSREAYYAAVAELAVSQGAARAGTEVTGLYQQLVGGTTTRPVADEMVRMGVLRPGDYEVVRGGKVKVSHQATERLAKEVGPDPIAWITGPLNDLMTQKGMDTGAKLAEVFRLFGRQTVQRLVAEALTAGPLFERSRHMFGNVPDVDTQYKDLHSKDLETNLISFHKAWQGFMEAMGEQGIPLAIDVLQRLTTALHSMSAWAIANPGTAHTVEMVAAALAGLTALGGGLAFLSVVALWPLIGAFRALMGLSSGLAFMSLQLFALSGAIARLVSYASGIASVASGLTAFAAGIGAVAAALYLGNRDPKKAQEEQENLSRQRRHDPMMGAPQDGFDAEGKPVPRKQSFIAPSPQEQHITVAVNGQVDGNTLLRFVTAGLVTRGSGPSSGMTGFDPRGGFQGNMQAIGA